MLETRTLVVGYCCVHHNMLIGATKMQRGMCVDTVGRLICKNQKEAVPEAGD